MPFCVDTSAWMDGWQRYYPQDVFPSLWAKLEEPISSGQIVSSEEVYVELKKKADDLHDWIKGHKNMLVPLSEQIQRRSSELLIEYPRLVDNSARALHGGPLCNRDRLGTWSRRRNW